MNSCYTTQEKPTYRIGAVSRLTGVAPDTLRVWERRYGAVIPFRSGTGTRLYNQEDIERLALIKQLVDGGDAISRVANLTMDQLRERARGSALPEPAVEADRPYRVAVLGSSLPGRIGSERSHGRQLQVVGLFRDRTEFLDEVRELEPDVVVLEYATVHPEQIREIGMLLLRSGAAGAVVVYNFATRATLDRLESPRIVPMRGPIDLSELERRIPALNARSDHAPRLPLKTGADIGGALPARRFDDETLTRIAASSATVRCECPQHLVNLIANLTAFETYSEECEVLNVDDAALHAFLHSATAQARSLLETALARVVEADAIDVEDWSLTSATATEQPPKDSPTL